MKRLTLIISLIFIGSTLSAQSAHTLLRSGDNNYKNQNFSKAEEDYRKAKGRDNSPKANYNLGNSVYQQEKFDEAAKHFQSTAQNAKTDATKSKAYYNMGNALLNAAQKAKDPKVGEKQLKEAIDAYKQSLRLNSKDLDAKHNLSMAMRQMQQRQQQKQQQNNQDQGDQNKQQQDQGKDDQQNQGKDNQQQQNQQSQQNQPQDQNQDEKQDGQQNGKEINRDEAEKLLEIMNDEEKKVQEKLRQRNAKRRKSDKDW